MIAVMFALLVVVSLLEGNELFARLPFIPVGLYIVLNWRDIREIEATGPTPIEFLENSKSVRRITISVLVLEIVAAYYLVFTGSHVATENVSIPSLFLALIGPMLPAVVVSRIQLHARLEKQDV